MGIFSSKSQNPKTNENSGNIECKTAVVCRVMPNRVVKITGHHSPNIHVSKCGSHVVDSRMPQLDDTSTSSNMSTIGYSKMGEMSDVGQLRRYIHELITQQGDDSDSSQNMDNLHDLMRGQIVQSRQYCSKSLMGGDNKNVENVENMAGGKLNNNEMEDDDMEDEMEGGGKNANGSSDVAELNKIRKFIENELQKGGAKRRKRKIPNYVSEGTTPNIIVETSESIATSQTSQIFRGYRIR